MIRRAAAMAASGLLAACVTTPEVSAPRIEGYLPAASVQALARTLPAPPSPRKAGKPEGGLREQSLRPG